MQSRRALGGRPLRERKLLLAGDSAGVNGPYRQPYVHGPAFTDSDLAVQKSFGLGGERSILVRYSAFNFLNHANTTYKVRVDPMRSR